MIKLNIISNDTELINIFSNISGVELSIVEEEAINESNNNIYIVSNKIIKLNILLSKRNNNKCFYLCDEDDIELIEKTDKSILKLKNIIIIPPKRTIKQIQQFVLNNLLEINNSNNVFTFFGSDSKVGTTSISQLIATNIAKRNKDKMVLMLFLDGQTGFDWIDNTYTKTCLADIKVALKNNLLTIKSLKDNCLKSLPNLYILKGEIAIKDNVFYHQNEINELIDICKSSFDFIIIDAGNTMNLSLRMSYAALINSDNKILITDQLPKSYEMYVKGKRQVLENLNIDDFKFMILNKYIRHVSLSKKEEIVEKYGFPIISTIPYIDYYYQAAVQKNLSLFEADKEYKDAIIGIVKYIEEKRGIVQLEKAKKLFSFLW